MFVLEMNSVIDRQRQNISMKYVIFLYIREAQPASAAMIQMRQE